MPITADNVEQFRELYARAVSEGVSVFYFEGQQILTAYAKYVMEYLNAKQGV